MPMSAATSCCSAIAAPGKPTLMASYMRSEEHTSELQSLTNLVCRLPLEKKKTERSYRRQRVLGGMRDIPAEQAGDLTGPGNMVDGWSLDAQEVREWGQAVHTRR